MPAEGLGPILDDQQLVLLGNGVDRIVVGRQAEKVYRNYRPQPRPIRRPIGDAIGQLGRIKVEGLRIDVDENRP